MAEQYPLQALRRLRQFKADAALRAQAAAEQAAAQTAAAVNAAEREVTEGALQLERRRQERYQAIMGLTLSLNDIEQFKLGLSQLDAAQLRLEQKVQELKLKLKQCRLHLEQCRVLAQKQQQEVSKLDQHYTSWLQIQKAAAERAAELELEDFIPRKNQ